MNVKSINSIPGFHERRWNVFKKKTKKQKKNSKTTPTTKQKTPTYINDFIFYRNTIKPGLHKAASINGKINARLVIVKVITCKVNVI